jgi:predicted Zn-dependent protease
VNANQLKEILSRANNLEKSDVLLLKKMQENFPFFQLPHALIARYEFQKESQNSENTLGWAAITSPDRIWLRQLIHQKPTVQTESKDDDLLPENLTKPAEGASQTAKLLQLEKGLKSNGPTPEEKPKPKTRRRKASGDDLIESIKKKEKKQIVDAKKKEQIDLIKAFSKKDIKMATIKEIEANQNKENLAESSTQIKEELITESFAKLLIKQGKNQKAVEIYEKLSLKFPEKSAYFANLIQNLTNTDS